MAQITYFLCSLIWDCMLWYYLEIIATCKKMLSFFWSPSLHFAVHSRFSILKLAEGEIFFCSLSQRRVPLSFCLLIEFGILPKKSSVLLTFLNHWVGQPRSSSSFFEIRRQGKPWGKQRDLTIWWKWLSLSYLTCPMAGNYSRLSLFSL